MTCLFCTRSWDADTCQASTGKDGFYCTRPTGHGGDHVACGVDGHDYARWGEPQVKFTYLRAGRNSPAYIPDGMLFRRNPAPEADYAAFRELYRRLSRVWNWPDRSYWTEDHWDRWHQNRRVWWFTVPGIGLIEMDTETRQIMYLGVLPEFRRLGHGRRLLEAALGAFPALWVSTTDRDSPEAMANYRARGMVVYREVVVPETIVKNLL